MTDDTTRQARDDLDAPAFAMRIASLSQLDEFEIADGYPEIRGWDVRDADDRSIGFVHDLLVDLDALRVRFLDVELAPRFADTVADRVLIPMERVDLDGTGDLVILPNVRGAEVRELVPFARRGVAVAADAPAGEVAENRA